MAEAIWHEFPASEPLAEALAETVARHLAAAVEQRGMATIAVSGGSTPPPFFSALSRRKIDWPRVTVTLVDERFVPPSSERSNAGLAARHLLQNEAAQAQFVGLYHQAETIEEAAEKADEEIGRLPLPLDVGVLGMGLDGHTASFFPDAEDIALKLRVEDRRVLPIYAKSAGESRLTLSLPLLCRARVLVLHVEGEEKRRVLQAALTEEDGAKLPVRIAVEQAAAPVGIYWAPGGADTQRSPGDQSAS
ncbi:6-phosphogluconolactonase [Chelativorans sp. AA-79]|uniref:6-phosphogluconolactonase n=1 Tax=Chelativorans sp. AA-79 TaxID=3028735 RepID=UPI0023F823D8|nr:6-phosphogluconolactonase [Chelativorans sp. AA-79]WEX08827.1 6-phosphogluconolactonase [Chelativorans sp. AA-79]